MVVVSGWCRGGLIVLKAARVFPFVVAGEVFIVEVVVVGLVAQRILVALVHGLNLLCRARVHGLDLRLAPAGRAKKRQEVPPPDAV